MSEFKRLKLPSNCRLVPAQPGVVYSFVGAKVWRQRDIRSRRAYHEAGHCVAAIQYSVPIKACTIKDGYAGMFRDTYQPPSVSIGVEVLSVLCLAGPAAETLFCGPPPPNDTGDRIDVEMARRYLAQRYDASKILFELGRARDSAERLVASPWAKERITRIAAALLKHTTLNSQDIAELVSCGPARSSPNPWPAGGLRHALP